MPRTLHRAITSDNYITEHRAKRAAGKDKFHITDGDGLYLDVDLTKQRGSTHIWRAMVYVNGRRTRESYGAYPLISIDRARELHEASQKLLAGQDAGKQVNPSVIRREANAAAQAAEALRLENARRHEQGETLIGTVKWYVEQVHALESPTWKPDYADEFLRVMAKDVEPTIGHLPIEEVTAEHVAEIFKGIVARKTGKSTKGNLHIVAKVRRGLVAVFDEALERKAIKAVPMTESKRSRKAYKVPAKTPQAAILTLTGLGKLVRAVGADKRVLARDAFFLALATGQRRDTVINARWDDIKWSEAEWHIPRWTLATEAAEAARLEELGIIEAAEGGRVKVVGAMKGDLTDDAVEPHKVPLSRQTMAMLQRLLNQQIESDSLCPFVFPAYDSKDRFVHGMGTNVIGEMLRDGHEAGLHGKHVLHGNRAMMRTLMVEEVGGYFTLVDERGVERQFDTNLALELQLDHTNGPAMKAVTSNLGSAYYRDSMLEQRRHLMQVWSDVIERELNRIPEQALVAPSPLAPQQLAALAALKARKAPAPRLAA
jgi:integrase